MTLKVLMLAPAPTAPGPVGKHTTHLVDALQSLGCDVDRADWGRTDAAAGLWRRVLLRFQDVMRIQRRSRASSYDVLVVKTAHDWQTLVRDLALIAACRRHVRNIVVQLHGSQPARLAPHRPSVFRWASALLAQSATGLLVLSTDEQRAWQELARTTPVRVVMNPYVRKHRASARALDAAEHPRRVLFVGRLLPIKGVYELVEAMTALRDLDVTLAVAGDGPERRPLETLAVTRDVRVEWLGHLDEVALSEEYRRAYAFVLPSWREGFPTVIAEAMDAALPIVASDICGMRDQLKEGVNALLVQPRDVAALAHSLRRLLIDPDLACSMGAANAVDVERFAPGPVATDYLSTLVGLFRVDESGVERRTVL